MEFGSARALSAVGSDPTSKTLISMHRASLRASVRRTREAIGDDATADLLGDELSTLAEGHTRDRAVAAALLLATFAALAFVIGCALITRWVE